MEQEEWEGNTMEFLENGAGVLINDPKLSVTVGGLFELKHCLNCICKPLQGLEVRSTGNMNSYAHLMFNSVDQMTHSLSLSLRLCTIALTPFLQGSILITHQVWNPDWI